ncbi:MAG: O-antigen ligase family protein, partial [Rickettsiales bacterium]
MFSIRQYPTEKLYIIIFLLGAVIAGQFVTKAIHGKYIETVDYAGRKEIWKRPMDAIKQSPTTFLLGTGSNTYDKVVKYPASVAPQDRHLWFAHNQYILLWQEFGIIGLVIICALFGVVLIRNIRIIKSAFAPERFNLRFGIIGITLLMVVHGYFDHQFTLTHSR